MTKAKIILLSPSLRGKEFELTDNVYSCGRTSDRDIEIADVTISSSHCTFTRSGDTYILADNHSTNGTRVNGELISDPVELKHTDILTIGMVEALYECANGAVTNTNKASVTTRINIATDMQKTVPCITTNFSPKALSKKNNQAQKIFIFIIIGLVLMIIALGIFVVFQMLNRPAT